MSSVGHRYFLSGSIRVSESKTITVRRLGYARYPLKVYREIYCLCSIYEHIR